jgi:hypothetical protein
MVIRPCRNHFSVQVQDHGRVVAEVDVSGAPLSVYLIRRRLGRVGDGFVESGVVHSMAVAGLDALSTVRSEPRDSLRWRWFSTGRPSPPSPAAAARPWWPKAVRGAVGRCGLRAARVPATESSPSIIRPNLSMGLACIFANRAGASSVLTVLRRRCELCVGSGRKVSR